MQKENFSVSNESDIRPWILAARPKTLAAGFAPVMLGSALAFYFGSFQLIPAVLCLLFSILVQIGCNYANDYYDYIKGVDTKERIGVKRMVNEGLIEPLAMRNAAYLILSIALIVGSGLIFYGGWWLVFVGLTSVFCAIAYTAGPYPIGYYGLGDIFVFIFFGLVATIFTFYVQANYFRPEVLLVAAGCGALAMNIRLVNDIRDRETDAKGGKKTSAVRFGLAYCYIQYSFCALMGLAVVPLILITQYNFNKSIAICVLMILPALFLVKKLTQCTAGKEYDKLLEKTAKLLLINSLALSIGIVLTSFAITNF